MEHSIDAPATLPPRDLVIVAGVRMVQMVAYRIIYPLLPFLALQLGVELGTVALLITVQVVASLLSPVGGALSAVSGQRATMMLGTVLFIVGTAVCAFASGFWGFAAGYALIGLAVSIYHPSAQSYLSARTPYARRGFALGIYEVSWAGAALLGVAPLMLLVDRTGHPQFAFALLAVAGLFGLGLLRLLPQTLTDGSGGGERLSLRVVLLPGVAALLAMMGLIMAGCDMFFVVQSSWLHVSFGAQAAVIGGVTAIQGASELIGSIGSAFLVDRIGKKRSVAVGYGAMALAALLLPFSSGQWWLFLPIFFVFVLGFEFGIVSSFPLASGVAPAARSVVLSLCTVAVGLGRTVGSLFAEPLWSGFGIAANTTICAVLTVIGLAVCSIFVHENEREMAS